VSATGWMGEDPGDTAPAMPVTEQLLRMRHREPGNTLAISMARSRAAEARQAVEEAASAPDPDERAANLVSRGYTPGLMSQLQQRLADTEAQLADEQELVEKAARRAAIVHREHQAGRIHAWDIPRMLDGPEGDGNRVRQLERRAESLKGQIAETAEIMAPQPRRVSDLFEQATQRAHAAFAEATRAAVAAAESGLTRPERRPFASGLVAVRNEPVTCPECIACDATPEESWLIHNDPQPMPVPADWAPVDAEAGRSGEVNVYQMPPEGWEAVRAHDRVDGVARRGTEGAIVGVR
jgi:hypothetical protein